MIVADIKQPDKSEMLQIYQNKNCLMNYIKDKLSLLVLPQLDQAY
jgi:hypothetical protein